MNELTRNQLFSENKRNFYIDKRAWDEHSKEENNKVLRKYAVERVEKLAETRDGIIGISHHVADAPRPRSL